MAVAKFEELLKVVGSKIQKCETVSRTPIAVTMKLELTVQYLASGDSITSRKYAFRIPKNTTHISTKCSFCNLQSAAGIHEGEDQMCCNKNALLFCTGNIDHSTRLYRALGWRSG